jgi:hypothetical protein
MHQQVIADMHLLSILFLLAEVERELLEILQQEQQEDLEAVLPQAIKELTQEELVTLVLTVQ